MFDETPAAPVHGRRGLSAHGSIPRRAARALKRFATFALAAGAALLVACATYIPGGGSRMVFDPGDAATRGPSDAAVLIVEFADFRCPHCERQQPVLRRLLAEYPQDVALSFVHLPVVAPDSSRAAIAAEAAGRQGAFWGMHDELFARLGRPLDEEDLRMVARRLGIDAEQFSADLRDPALVERVRADLASADALGIDGTPALLVNGRLLVGIQSHHRLHEIVEQELRAAR